MVGPTDRLRAEFKHASDSPDSLQTDVLPVKAIRQIDGSEEGSSLIGYVNIFRCPTMEVENVGIVDRNRGKIREKENNALPAGDPHIVWAIACKYTVLPHTDCTDSDCELRLAFPYSTR